MLAKAQEGYDIKKHATLYSIHSNQHEASSSPTKDDDLSAENEIIPEDFLAMTSLDEVTRADQRLGACLQQPSFKR